VADKPKKPKLIALVLAEIRRGQQPAEAAKLTVSLPLPKDAEEESAG
jgi:hypothetical protein